MPSRAPWTVGSAMTYIPDDDPDYPFEGLSIFGADGDQIAIVPTDFYIGLAQATKNAQLIAAAPDLLAACKVALDALGCDRLRQDRLEAQRIIKTAVNRAESQ